MTDRSAPTEQGLALVVALMAMAVLMAIGTALVVITSTEAIIAGNFHSGREALYAAEAVAELVVADLRSRADWAPIIAGAEGSRFVDGAPDGPRSMPGGAPLDLTTIVNFANCGTMSPCGGAPKWRLFAYGPLRDLAPADPISPFYVVALIGRPSGPVPGAATLDVRAEAFGPRGASQTLTMTLERTAAGGTRVLRRAP